MSGCLGDRVADLADGRLDPAAAERALAHVAGCPTCRTHLDAQRAASAALRALAPGEPAADLLAGLRRIGLGADSEGPLDPAAPAAAVGAIPAQGGAEARPPGQAGGHPPVAPRRRRRAVLASAASVAAVAALAVVGASATTAGAPSPSPAIAPVVDLLADAHSSTTTERMPLTGPRVVSVGLSDPLSRP